MQIVTSWMEEGIQQGELKIIQRQLTKRIGAIAPELQEQLPRLSLTQLEDLAEALLDFATEADLMAWLQQQQ
jgi:hydroxymethylglutaryl-CoA reductase